MTDDPQFSDADLAACAEREAKQRKKVYARLIARGTMSPETAAREIAMMREIAARFYAEVEESPRKSGMLI